MYYDKMHEIPVWLRTGSNPTDIIRFQTDTGIIMPSLKSTGEFFMLSVEGWIDGPLI